MHFNRVILTVCIVLFTMPFDCANSGLLVSCLKSQVAENCLNSREVNSGPLSEKTSLGIPCLANIAFIFFITIGEVSHWVPLSYGLVPHLSKKLSKLPLLVRCCWWVCWFQNSWGNSPQQWVRFSLVFWIGPYRFLSRVCQKSHGYWVVQHLDGFCIVGMPHNLISYLLFQHSCLARIVSLLQIPALNKFLRGVFPEGWGRLFW